jgi:hypothetical protein
MPWISKGQYIIIIVLAIPRNPSMLSVIDKRGLEFNRTIDCSSACLPDVEDAGVRVAEAVSAAYGITPMEHDPGWQFSR